MNTQELRAFSLVEALIAMLLFMTAAIAIIPLFARSVANNNIGKEKSDAATFLRRLEAMAAVPLGLADTTVPAGTVVEAKREAYCQGAPQIGDSAEGWKPSGTCTSGHVLFERETRNRQFSIGVLDTTGGTTTLEDADAIRGGERPENVHLTVTEIEIEGRRLAGPLGPGLLANARSIRAF
jgi:Tfp pilus assembly protein PilV